MTGDPFASGGACGIPRPNPRFDRGLEVLHALNPREAMKILGAVSDIAPGYAAYLVEYVFGDIAARPGLGLKQQAFAGVAILAAISASPQQLEQQLRSALVTGWTRQELVELTMQVSVLGGYPAAIRALQVLDEVVPPAAQAAAPG
jgi:4-carboxymuconolactone decarboxylase